MRNQFFCLAAVVLLVAFASCMPAAKRSPQPTTLDYEEQSPAETSQEAGSSKQEGQGLQGDWCPVAPKGMPQQILENAAYVSSFNSETLLPNWVAWRLTANHVNGTAKRKDAAFTPDDRIDEAHRVTTYDYMRSGYDRGHLCPAGDNRWSTEAMEQCFLMTNICPQDHGLNVGDWNEMESQCRRWAEKYGEIYIVCGPILFKGKHKRIGKVHKVTVPEAFFKVVLRLGDTPKGIGFIYRNEDGNRPKGDYVNTIDQVERITGLDFFPTLPDGVEKKVEANADIEEW